MLNILDFTYSYMFERSVSSFRILFNDFPSKTKWGIPFPSDFNFQLSFLLLAKFQNGCWLGMIKSLKWNIKGVADLSYLIWATTCNPTYWIFYFYFYFYFQELEQIERVEATKAVPATKPSSQWWSRISNCRRGGHGRCSRWTVVCHLPD